jgi:flavin reductase (DIM6/NTAB) family NADH-FMN oxidoreductase RutF
MLPHLMPRTDTAITSAMRVLMNEATAAVMPDAFRFAMRRLASTVCVVTARSNGTRTGMTASSVTSLTVDPAALLVCVNQSASIHGCLEVGTPFCVNVLASVQGEISTVFAGRLTGDARFAYGVWTPDERGVPRLEEAQANISCVVDRMLAYGTHSVVIGRVTAVRISGAVDPLIFQDGRYVMRTSAASSST